VIPASDYTDLEVAGTLQALQPWWDEMLKGLDPTPVADLVTEGARVLVTGDDPLDVIDRSLALLQEAARRLAASGQFGTGTGSVHGLFASGGGVPKLPVDEAVIDLRGVVGDVQTTRRHHGRPWQALCLWSKEKVDRLAAEGHPITYGAAGENVSITGIDWVHVRPGVRLQIGAVLVECSLYSLPCAKNRQWFADRDSTRMHHETEPGISRMYASVLVPGTVRPGDPVVLEPT
jgi:MOSC domain-containing protein YiiM